MVKNEKTTGESCAQRPCRCAKVLPIVTFVLLVPTLILSVMAYLKINSVFKSTVELQFANESNLNKLHAVTQIKEYQEQITKKIDDQVEQLKNKQLIKAFASLFKAIWLTTFLLLTTYSPTTYSLLLYFFTPKAALTSSPPSSSLLRL